MLAKMSSFFHLLKTFDPNSLGFRLTFGIALLSSLGLGSVALWMSWKMENLLMTTHKETVNYVAERFPHDVQIYREMVTLEKGIQKTINNLSSQKYIFWFKNNENKIVGKSAYFTNSFININSDISLDPKVITINDDYWLICGIFFNFNDELPGKLYIAQNVTNEKILFTHLIRSLTIATIIATSVMICAIALYVTYLLKPLEEICEVAENVSADDLKQTSINFKDAPSEVKKLSDSLEKMLIRLGESWDNQQQLLSNVSHELRTPLTIISGYLQSILRRGDNLNSIQKEALLVMTSETNRTIKMLEDLLNLARVESGNIALHLEIFVVNDLIREIIAIAQQYSQRKINLEENSCNLKIKVDSDRFKQICLNLIDNALKYSPEDKEITIKIKNGKSVAVEFQDYGRGIPLSQQNRIFERFYRLDEARNREVGGTGLGLAIVKSLVVAMNGEITLYSQPEKGSIFIINFPQVL